MHFPQRHIGFVGHPISNQFRDITITGYVVEAWSVMPWSMQLLVDVPDGLSVAPPVPEPSTWAMLLIGFAGMGFVGYRRRHNESRMVRAVCASLPWSLSLTLLCFILVMVMRGSGAGWWGNRS
jgi:hypothetical protein